MCVYRMAAKASSRQGLLVGSAYFLCLFNGGCFLFHWRLLSWLVLLVNDDPLQDLTLNESQDPVTFLHFSLYTVPNRFTETGPRWGKLWRSCFGFWELRLSGNSNNSKHYYSVQFSHSVMSESLRPHGLKHTRLPCPSPTPRVYSNSCPLCWGCHPTISSSDIYSCLQSFPASGSFPLSWLFASGGQSIGVSASAWVLSVNIQGWFPLGWTGWISLQSKGLSRVFSNTTVQKHQFFSAQLSL